MDVFNILLNTIQILFWNDRISKYINSVRRDGDRIEIERFPRLSLIYSRTKQNAEASS